MRDKDAVKNDKRFQKESRENSSNPFLKMKLLFLGK